jgi:hypothetical protein
MQVPIECGWLASRARHWFGRDAEHRPRGAGGEGQERTSADRARPSVPVGIVMVWSRRF